MLYRSNITLIERAVVDCPGLSFAATGIYAFMASICQGDTSSIRLADLRERFGCSANTLKKSIDELVERGFVERKRGRFGNKYRLVLRS